MSRRQTRSIALRTHVSCLLAFILLTAAPLLGQGKNMGQATQYYKQTPPKKFKVIGPKKGGSSEITWSLPPGAHPQLVKDEYAILEPEPTVLYQDIKIHADKVTLNFKTKDVVAQGHVVIDQGPNRIVADQVYFNLDTKLGTFFHATAMMEPSLNFTGDKIEKTGIDKYHLENGVFTSCDLDKPSWSFHVKTADITLDDYAHLRDFSFRTHDVPVFWSPLLVWPTKPDRSRGFLIPRLLLSNRYGQRVELGYFVPIGDSADTTFYADLNTKGYNGVGFDLRYLPSQNVKIGDLSTYTVHDPMSGNQQWKYHYRHAEDNLPGGFRGVVDAEDFSDLEFFRDFDRDPRIHTLSQIYSSAYLTKNRPTYSLNILTDRRDIDLGVSNARQQFEQLPSVQFRVYPQRIAGSPFYFSMESSASHLAMNNLTNVADADYGRADFFPTLSLQLRTPPWLSIRPQVSFRETYYTHSLDPNLTRNAAGQEIVTDNSLTRSYGQAQVEVVGPSFSKVFNVAAGGFSKFKHVIEPRVTYVYTTDVLDKERQVIPFDLVDTPSLPIVQDSVQYSLTNRLIGKESGPNGNSREVLSLAFSQSVSLSKPFTDATGGSLGGTSVPPGNSKFTPLVSSLHFNPYQTITFDASATVGSSSHKVQQTSLSANLVGTGERADKYLSFTYFATYNDPTVTTFSTSSSQFHINTGSSILHDHLRADLQLAFDAKTGQFLEQRYLIGGNGSCYGIALEYRRYQVYVPVIRPATSYGISVTLKNVGTIGTH
jgi:lipopolysaccharide assembly outer membrane protein LptD (OstA)